MADLLDPKLDDLSAFPFAADAKIVYRGMSLRDYFAAHAPHAPITDLFTDEAAQMIAVASYRYADAMLKERAK